MVKHRVVNGKYGSHIVNEKVDTVDTLLGYICNLDNINAFKIIVGNNNIKAMINEFYDLEDESQVPIVKSIKVDDDKKEHKVYYTVKELSEKIRHRLYHIKHNDKVSEVYKELMGDISAIVNVKAKEFIIGIDNSKKDIDKIYNVIKESFDMLEIKNYTIFVYEGVEKWEEK